MLFRLVATVAALLTLTIPASALSTARFSDPALAAAASRMSKKDYRGAREAALKCGDAGVRAFLVGVADQRLDMNEEAALQLAYAAEALPLLGDYALYNAALALSKVPRPDEAVAVLQKLVKGYPGSRLVRPALLLNADTLFAAGRYKEALAAYGAFVERYPLGNDSLGALYGSALSREKLGDLAGAVSVLRTIWINNPASPLAQKATDEMTLISGAGFKIPPYSSDELLKRATAQYDQGQFGKAAQSYAELLSSAGGDWAARLRLKLGQAQYKARHYKDAQETLKKAAEKGSPEGSYWLARALDKNGNSEEAYHRYLALSERSAGGNLADEALLDAAYLRRYQGRLLEASRLFQDFLARFPDSAKRPSVLWETAWVSYQSRDYKGACDFLNALTQYREWRERALYWLGRAKIASGDQKGGEADLATVCADYPFGYYALLCNGGKLTLEPPRPPAALAQALPLPSGFEREKALIALGLFDEAARELSNSKKGAKNPLGVARLYLEMENYNAAFHLLPAELPKVAEADSALHFGISFPLAFRLEVAKEAAAHNVPESLVYAVMRAESNFSPTALSPVGAVGLMQIMPATAEQISKGGGSRLTTPELNIRLGARHLRDLLDSFQGNIPLSVAAYNAGSGNARRWQKSFGNLPLDEFVESITFKETREYVKKVTSVMALYQRLYALPQVSPVASITH